MSTRDVFSEQLLARLRGFLGITAEEMIQFVTPSLADEAFARHAARGDIDDAHQRAVRRRHLEQQPEHAWCLTIVTHAVSTGTADCFGPAVEARGRLVDEALLRHILPVRSENIGLIGSITGDIDAEPARLGPDGHPSLRRPVDSPSGP